MKYLITQHNLHLIEFLWYRLIKPKTKVVLRLLVYLTDPLIALNLSRATFLLNRLRIGLSYFFIKVNIN